MAHHSMFDPDPANPGPPADDAQSDSERNLRVEDAPDKLDLAELVEKFTVHGRGRVSAQVSADLALDLVLNQIAEQACLATPASGAAIVLARDGEWVCRASAGSNAPALGARLNAEAGLSGECIKTMQIQRCDDAQSDPRADVEACRSLGVRSVLILPLLQDDELVGVFEVFASQPAAFGTRDEGTLTVLSRRVLTGLRQTSQPLPLSTEVSPLKPGEVFDERPEEPIVGSSRAEDSIVESAIPENLPASSSPATQAADYMFEDASIPEAPVEVAPGRGLNVLTWALGGAVLAFTLLLALSMGLRLLRGKTAARTRPRIDVSAKQSDGGHNPAPNSSPTETGAGATKSKETKTNLSDGNPRGSAGLSNHQAPTGLAAANTAGSSPRPASAPLIPGSLQIFEKGKEIFRMPPAADQGQPGNVQGANGVTSADAGGRVAKSVEPAAIYELTPEAASVSLLHRVEPEYPQEALERQIQGPVALDVRIARDGTVQTVKLVSGQSPLTDAAMAAVKQWRFRPHLTKGQPVEMQTIITLNFRLPH